MEYSPIAFFAFNRPYHTYETLNSLSKNSEAKNTDLYAFIDGHRKISEIHLIDSVEKIIKSFSNKFKTITINRRNLIFHVALILKEEFQKFYQNMKLS